MKETIIKELPKVELHCHLDGSVSMKLLEQLAAEQGMDLARLATVAAPAECEDLMDYLQGFDVILELLQTEDSLRRAAFDVAEQAAQENVCYLELRFAPLLHQHRDLSLRQIIRAVTQGILEAEEHYPINVNLLICGMRQQPQAVNQELFQEVSQLRNENQTRIVGIDFAGDEQAFPPETLRETLDSVADQQLAITLHAGECGCAHNVYESIQLGATRIGHGVAIKDDPAIMDYCRDQEVLLEMCPTSNLQTKAIASIKEYPLRIFLDHGILCSINTDNRTVSSTTLTNEYMLLGAACGLTYEEMREINLAAMRKSFAGDGLKQSLVQRITERYDVILGQAKS